MTRAVVETSLYELTRNPAARRRAEPISARRSADLNTCRHFSLHTAMVSRICSYQAAAGLREALQPAAASLREENPTARMERAAINSRNDFSFGYAITRRSRPVSVRSPAITA